MRLVHTRKYKIADIVLSLKSDFIFRKDTYMDKFHYFEFQDKADDEIEVYLHHNGIPQIKPMGKMVYCIPPVKIYQSRDKVLYELFVQDNSKTLLLAIFNHNYKEGHIYKSKSYKKMFKKGNQSSLLSFPTDRVFFSTLLGKRKGMIVHSCCFILGGKGYVFVGHSGSGKTTIAKIFLKQVKLLNDDQAVIRKKRNNFCLFGNPWYGETGKISPDSAPLGTIFFLHKAKENRLKVANKKEAVLALFGCAIKPLIDREWAEKTLELCEEMAEKVPCYHLYFKKDKSVVEFLKRRVFEKQKD